jgi:hypothetical protein
VAKVASGGLQQVLAQIGSVGVSLYWPQTARRCPIRAEQTSKRRRGAIADPDATTT